MKKLLLVLLVGLGLTTSAFADHEGLGVGFIGGWGWPSHGYAGLSLKVPKLPIFWGIYPVFAGQSFGVGVTGDFYFIDKNLVSSTMTNEDGNYNFKLDWFLGLGMFLNTWFWDGGANVGLGARVPIGLSWHIIKQLELFFDFAPGVGVSFNSGGVWGPYWAGALEIGLRFWM
jgi:hypothetical protein